MTKPHGQGSKKVSDNVRTLETLGGTHSLKETVRTFDAHPSNFDAHPSKERRSRISSLQRALADYQERKVFGGIFGYSWTTSIHAFNSQMWKVELKYQGMKGSLLHEIIRVQKHSPISNNGYHIIIWEESKAAA